MDLKHTLHTLSWSPRPSSHRQHQTWPSCGFSWPSYNSRYNFFPKKHENKWICPLRMQMCAQHVSSKLSKPLFVGTRQAQRKGVLTICYWYERVWEIVLENEVFYCVPFCFRSLGRLERCDPVNLWQNYANELCNVAKTFEDNILLLPLSLQLL